jgi:putative glycosyltransferase (TIGR04372 family)
MKSRDSLKRLMGARAKRWISLCLRLIGAFLRLLPRRAVFFLFVLCDVARLSICRFLYVAYLPYVIAFLVETPGWRFAGRWCRFAPKSVARVLVGIGAYQEASDWIWANGLLVLSKEMITVTVLSLFELGEFERARIAVSAASVVDLEQDYQLALQKSMLDAIGGDYASARANMDRACRQRPQMMRPHQNIASRPGGVYFPNSLDTQAGASGRLFDLCNFTGQRVTHVGRGDIGVGLFERALKAQRDLQESLPILSPKLKRLLVDMEIELNELRVIPEEWTTQIGHLGMLDILFRMRELGWWSGKAVLVVRPRLIANTEYLRLFEKFGRVVVIGKTVSERVGEELLSLQRWCGLNFNAFRLPSGEVVPWQEAGALAIQQWEREGRGHPMRDAYDELFGQSEFVNEGFSTIRKKWGMKPDDWYVCLHTRDAAHYLEFRGTGQTHRNAPIEASFDAIRFITAQGGWVIKLGGPNSPKLPKFDRTVDYALSDFRSNLMDLQLIRHARAFIGTTSGLTNVAISFGIPSALVNAITTDAQLWSSNVRFALKPVRVADGTMITQRQLTATPWRWSVFDAVVLRRSGGHPVNNSADEILGTVKEVDALANGRSAEFEADYDATGLLSRWKGQLSLPHYYGASRPSLYYLKKYDRELLACGEC